MLPDQPRVLWALHTAPASHFKIASYDPVLKLMHEQDLGGRKHNV